MRATGFKLAPDGRLLERIGRLLDSGDIRVHVDEVFDWEEAAAAHRMPRAGTRAARSCCASGECAAVVHRVAGSG